ncbi:MAG: beta strand repeat-containing protein [Candidatus Nanopelagicaceae bacterium]
MSDIFIKTAASGSTGWKKMTNLFVKTASSGSTGWKAALGVWIRGSASWLKVWPLSGVFATRAAWFGPTSGTVYADRMPSTAQPVVRIGSSYFGNNAQWDPNGWVISSYSYAWEYYNGTGSGATVLGTLDSGTGSGWTSGGSGQDELLTTVWTSTVSTNTDRQYLGFKVTANASNSSYSGSSVSSKVQIIRRIPQYTGSPSLSTNSPQVGTSITYTAPTWDTTEARKAESYRTTIQWYRNSTSTTTGGTPISGATSSSYTPNNTDDLGKYIYVVETRYNSGTDYDLGATVGVEAKVVTTSTVADINYQAAGNQRRVNLPSNFTNQTTLYVSTNGYIGINSDPSSSISPPSSGLYLMPLQGDQRQTALWTYSDANNFYVRWQGARYNDAAQTIDYQAKFYFNSTAVDVYFVTNNLSSSNPASTTAVYNNGVATVNWSGSTAQSSTLISTSSMTRDTTKDGVDDDRTVIGQLSDFSYTVSQGGTVTTPVTPSIVRVSSTSNTVLFEIAASKPADTFNYGVNQSGAGAATTGTPAQFVSTLNEWDSNGGYAPGTGTYDTISTINSSANNSPFTISTTAYGATREAYANVSTTTGASSWAINFTWSNASSSGTSYWSNGSATSSTSATATVTVYSNSMPVKIASFTGTNNPTVTINSITAYSGSGQTGGGKAGTSGATTSLVINRPSSTSASTTQNYTYYVAPITYTISYNANSATSGTAPASQTKTQGVNLTLRTNTGSLARTGYTYDGWNTNSSGTGTSYAAGGTYSTDAAATMYAKWIINTYTISYDKNTTDTVGNMPSSQTKTYNVNLTLSSNTPTRTGFTFSGWATSSGGSVVYAAGGTYTANAGATLYAKWTATVSVPSGGTVTLTGSGVAGTSLSASTQGWSGSPTSYNLTIRVSTTSTVSSTGTIKASTTSSSTSYPVTTSDANAPAYYFKAFATATNSGGTSLTTAESGTILSSRLQKPTGLSLSYNGWNGSQHSWTATWNSVTGASSYTAYREVGPDDSPFTVAHTSTPQTGITGTSTTFTTGTQANDWARFYVKAVNSLDDSGYAGPSNVA